MKTNLNNRTRGFTIIEVMIVLAVAGLILAVVLLAVPALQRTQRNNARRNDAVHLAGLVSDYISNHGGIPPNPGNTFSTSGESFSQLTGASPNANIVNSNAQGGTITPNVNTGQSCNTTTNILSPQPGAFAISFGVEAPGVALPAGSPVCIPG